jgi:hypothetical protein
MKEKVPFSLISKLIKAYKGDEFSDTWPQIAKRYLSLLLVLPNESSDNQGFLLHFLCKRLLRRRANDTN